MRLFDESAPARSAAARAATRLSLGASPAVLAAMLALQPQVARAQAFQGTETVILGSVTRGTSGNNDFFTVDALQNTINWTPTDTATSPNPIDFLPAGAFASFSGGSGTNGANYTVLNRIIAADPTRAIAFSGTVSSDAAGRIWFYAPGGLLLNASSQFNVGSLLLTANDPVGAAAGLPYLDAANSFRLQAGATSTALVDIRAGAQINAANSGSYVIAVAPRFNHAGAINVNGSAALVAAQDVSFTLNGGLFDITANVGSSAGGNQTVTGSITGPGGIGGQGVFSRIYMMAVPRNDAMTLLITGDAQLGFNIANAADISGNAIVLSGGYDIVGTPAGQGVTQYGLTPVAGSVGTATLSIDNADFTSSVSMRSKDQAFVLSAAGPGSFAADLEVLADSQAIVRGVSGNVLTVAGNLIVDASAQFTGATNGANRTAGIAEVSASGGGSVQVSGNTFVYAVGVGDNASSPGIAGGTGTGGNASAGAFGGSLRTGSLTIDASGVGGIANDGVSGSGLGGTARLQVDPDGTLTMAGNLLVTSDGIAETGSLGRQSGNATAGLAEVRLSGIVNVPGGIRVDANASYGESGDIGHTGGGTGTGGQALLSIFDGTSLTTTDIAVEAQANRGFSVGNNNFIGGQARFSVSDVNGGTSVTAQSIAVLAQATAANGDIGGNVDGGAATGGFAQLLTTGNPTVSGSQIFVSANASGGDGDGGIGGAALGGRAHLDMQNGGSLLISNNVFVNAAANGGDGTIGGNATALDNGDANPPAVFVRLGPNVGTNDQGIQLVGGLFLIANANGGDGTTGAGGAARGGFVVLRGQSGEINAGQVIMQSDAFGGFGVGGGAARSGRLFGGFNDANLTTGQLFLTVEANGGSASDAARGGDATVGQAFFILDSLEAGPGTTVNAGAVSVLAAARGGSGGGSSTTVGGAGGDAFAVDPNAQDPQIVIAARPARSSFIASQLIVDNSAVGGEGGGGLGTVNGGRGGNAAGGNINIGTTSGPVTPLANRSTFDFGTLYSVDGRVTGGNGGGIDGDGLGGRGGDATGGGASLLARGSVVTAGAVSILTSAFGGNGGGGGNGDLGGGNATGGESIILATPHFTAGLPVDVTITGAVSLIATGLGGSSSAAAGEGQGGTASVRLQRHEAPGAAAAPVVGSMSIASLSADAGGVGGTAQGSGASGGAGIGGAADIIAEGGPFDLIGGAQLTAIGRGTNGAAGNTGQQGGDGGAAIGGSATVTVRPGGILTMPLLTADVSAAAGLGGDGGNGANGLTAANPLPPQRDGNPGGNGQAGGNGGAGGAAVGGDIIIGTPADNSGGSITISSWTLVGEAVAGVGGSGGVGGAGANGGAGLDGDALFINGGNGGPGGSGGAGGNAGAGGSANGSDLQIGALSNDQGTAWSLNVPLITASMVATAGGSGLGGQGGTPGLGGAGGAPGLPPGVAGQIGANGFFGGQGLDSIAGFTQGPTLQVFLYGADLTAPGIDLSADANGAFATFGGQAGDAQAGAAALVISGGTTSLGYVRLSAIGVGGGSVAGFAGTGRGGIVAFRVLDGAAVTLGVRIAPLQLVADGLGGDGMDGGLGGSGFAGSIITQVNNANLQVNGDLVMVAEGFAGFDGLFAGGTGGTLTLAYEDGSTVGVTDQLIMSARALAPVANGGFVNIAGSGTGSLQVDGDIALDASVLLQQGFPGSPSAAGEIVVSADVDNRLVVGGQLGANASATSFSQVPNASMAGGLITVGNRGSFSVGGALSFDASAVFSQGAGGGAIGGSVLIETLAGTLESNGLSLSASADGGFVTAGAVPTASGGTIVLRNEAGAAHFSRSGNIAMTANAIGIGNNDGPGGDGAAGFISLGVEGTLELDMGGTGTFVADVIGTGGSSSSGDFGGNGFGGDIDFIVGTNGTLNIINPGTPLIELKANGIGGNSLTQGGNGTGGAIFLVATEASMTMQSLILNVRGEGGLGLPSGNALGGRADVVARESLVSIGGDLVLDGNAVVAGSSVEGNGTGGLLGVDVAGSGTLDVAGNLQMLANGDGTANLGGTIAVNVGFGLLDVGGGITLRADSNSDALGSNAVIQGGQINVDVGSLGEIRSAQGLTAETLGTGLTPLYGTTAQGGTIGMRSAGGLQLGGSGLQMLANGSWALGTEGGNGSGGSATVQLIGGSFDTSNLTLRAFGVSGANSGGVGGTATGGTVAFEIDNGAVATVTGTVGMNSFGDASGGLVGGQAIGGSLTIAARNGGQLLGNAFLDSITAGGRGGNGLDGDGGSAIGGSLLIRAESGGSLAVGRLRIASAGSTGGNGAGAGNGGAAVSGTVEISANGGTIDITNLQDAVTSANGGNASGTGNGGEGRGGTVSILANNAAQISILATGGTTGIGLGSSGVGGNAVSGLGANGIGGLVQVSAGTASQITLDARGASTPRINMRARGIGGQGASGGTGTGGQVLAGTAGDGQLNLLGQVELIGEASGGTATGGNGGNALAGRVELAMRQAVATTSITTGDLTILAGATAGNGAGILGRGGLADTAANSGVFIGSNNNLGTMAIGNVNAVLTAIGGQGGDGLTNDGGDGGTAIAGRFTMGFRAFENGGATAGTITTGLVQADASARGGAGGAGSAADGAGGRGGDGLAGGVEISAFGGTLSIAPGAGTAIGLQASASGLGGAGGDALIAGNGGAGFGGEVNMGSSANVRAGGQLGRFVSTRQQVSADGEGGAGAVGGEGTAGGIEIRAFEGSAQVNGLIGWSTTGLGGNSTAGIGGEGGGGAMSLFGAIGVTSSVVFDGSGRGGDGSDGGGSGFGGQINLRGDLALQSGLEGFVTADGGNALQSGTGGRAEGGVVDILTINAEAIVIAGFAEIFADARGGSGAIGGDATGANVRVNASQPATSIDLGGLDIRGNANGGAGGVLAVSGPARSGSASGGTIAITSNGTIRVRSDLSIQQSRTAGTWLNGIGDGGSASGGTMQIRATADPNLGGGLITVDGVLSVVANAVGGDVNFVQPGAGGNANGANLTLSATAGTAVDLVGGAALIMNTLGGTSAGGAGGASTGARFVTTVNASTVNIGGTGLNVIVDSRGGTGFGGGASQGAAFDLFVDSGAFSVAGNTAIRAESAGGFGTLGTSGGNAGGADIRLLLTGPDNNSRLQLSTAGLVELNTITRGGRGGDGVGNIGGAGGTATGGSIELGAIGSTGTIAMGDLQASVFAEGGTGGDGVTVGGVGGSAQGGFVSVGMAGNTQGPAGNFTVASADLDASARGGNGGAGQTAGASGDAAAGSVGLAIRGATGSVAGNVDLFANATSLGNARGGVVELSSEGGGSGVAGDFAIAGDVRAEALTTGATSQAGVVRVFALDGSRLAMATLVTSANGNQPSASPLRGGLVADTGSTIAIAGDGQVVSQQSLGFNDGGTITVGGRLFVSSGGQVRSAFDVPATGAIGTIAAQTLEISATQGIDLVTNTTGSNDVLMNSSSSIQLRDIDANRDISISAANSISFTSMRADRNVFLGGNTGLNGGSVSTGGRMTLVSDTAVTLGALDAGIVDPFAGPSDIYVRSLGPVTTGAVTSAGDVGLVAQGALLSGSVTSGRDLVLLGGGTITTAALTTPTTGRIRIDDFVQRSLITFPGGVPDYTALFAAAGTARVGDTIINGNVTTGLVEARSTGLLRVTGTINAAIGARLGVGSLQVGSLATQGFLDLSAVDSLVLADLAAQGQISLASDGSITAGNITTGQSLVLAANRPGATLTTGNVRADGEIRLSSNTTLTAGTLSSGNRVFLTAGGAITTGAIDAGTVNPQQGASGVLFATSPGTIRTGPINVSGSATLSGVLGVTTGNVTAPGGIVLLDTGGINAGNLSTSPSGFVYIAAHDLLPQISFDQAGNPLFAALLASTPIRLVGDITVGDATTGRFIAAATGNFFVNNATAATSMLVDVGGTATLDFNINTPSLTVTSSDIFLDPLAAVGAAGGSILFNVGSGSTTTIIGGANAAAVPGTYRLSNGEFGALRASSITVRSFAGGMTVDQLALPAIAPGQAANPGVTLQTNGTMRVTGAVTMAQAGADNRLNLLADTRIEVVQGSGSVRLGAGVDTPAGTLAITAPRLWVASDSLLTQLAGSTLSGQARIDAVNAAGAPIVVGGSIGAGTILIGTGEEVLIQNSGTNQLKAGFTTGTGGLRIRRAFEGNNPINVVINGRIQRADNSFATNRDTLALVQLDPGISLVTADSTVNGCLIVSANCPGLLPDEIVQPVVTIVNNIEELTPEQEEQRAAAQAAAEKLPIVLLQRLIDFSPLFVDPDATDPVTSGGNPALWMDPMPRGVRAPGGLK